MRGDNLYDGNRRKIVPNTKTNAVSTNDDRVLDDVLDAKADKANTVRFEHYDEETGLTELARFNASTGEWEKLEGLSGGGGGGGSILPGLTLSPEPGEEQFNYNRSVREDEDVEIRFSWQSANLGLGTVVVAATNRSSQVNWINREIHRSSVRQGPNLINIGALPQGVNLIGIWILDSAGLRSNVEEFTVNSGALEIAMNTDPNAGNIDFDVNRVFSVGQPITLTFRARSNAPVGTPHQIQITNIETGSVTTGILTNITETFSLQTYQMAGLGIGEYTFDIRITHSNSTFISNIVRVSLIVSDANTVVIGSPFKTSVGHQNEPQIIPYRIGMVGQTQFVVRRYVRGTPETQLVTALNAQLINWPVTLLKEGSEEVFGISVWLPTDNPLVDKPRATREWTIRVIESTDSIQPVQNGLTAWFDARIMDNSDRSGVWRSRVGSATAQLHGFNFDTNGFIGGTLVCDGASHVEVNIKPFSQPIPAEGLTIEITYEATDTGNPNARVFDCTHATAPSQLGINISTNMAHMRSNFNNPIVGVPHVRTDRIAHTKPNAYNHVAFVWDPLHQGINTLGQEVAMPMTFIYVDGVVVDATILGASESFLHNENIFINSARGNQLFGLCNIRSLRIYNRALDHNDIVNNYISDIADPEKRELKYEQNFNLQKALPQMEIFHDEFYDEVTNPNPFPITENSGSSTRATARIEYTDFRANREVIGEDDNGNEIVIETPVNDPFPNNGFVSIAHQGASSLSFPMRNYRIRFGEHFTSYNSDGSVMTDILYEIKPEEFVQREDGKWEAYRRTPFVALTNAQGPTSQFRYKIHKGAELLEESAHIDPDFVPPPPEKPLGKDLFSEMIFIQGEMTSNSLDGLPLNITPRFVMNQGIIWLPEGTTVVWMYTPTDDIEIRGHAVDENGNQMTTHEHPHYVPQGYGGVTTDSAWTGNGIFNPRYWMLPPHAKGIRVRFRHRLSYNNGGRLSPEEVQNSGIYIIAADPSVNVPHDQTIPRGDNEFTPQPSPLPDEDRINLLEGLTWYQGSVTSHSLDGKATIRDDNGNNSSDFVEPGEWCTDPREVRHEEIVWFPEGTTHVYMDISNSAFNFNGVNFNASQFAIRGHAVDENGDQMTTTRNPNFSLQADTQWHTTTRPQDNQGDNGLLWDTNGVWELPSGAKGMRIRVRNRQSPNGTPARDAGLPLDLFLSGKINLTVEALPSKNKNFNHNISLTNSYTKTIFNIRNRMKMYVILDEKPEEDVTLTVWQENNSGKVWLNGRRFWQNINNKIAPNYRWNPKADFMDSSMINEPFLSALLNGWDVNGNPYPQQRRVYSKDVPGVAWGNSLTKEGRQDLVHYHYCGLGSGNQNRNGRNWHLTTMDYDFTMAPNITAYPMNVILNGIPQGIYNMNTDKNDAVQYGLYDYDLNNTPEVTETLWGSHTGTGWGNRTRTIKFNRVLSFEGLENSAALSTTFRTWQPDRRLDGSLKEFVSGEREIDEENETRNGHNQFPDAWSYYGQGWDLRYASPTGNGSASGDDMSHPDTRKAYDFFIDLIEWTNTASSAQFVNTINEGARWVRIDNPSQLLGTGVTENRNGVLWEQRPVFDKEYLLKFYLMQQVFLMVDNGAKNTFFNTWDGITWYPQFWDVDTAMGVRNSGHLNVPVDAMPGFGNHWYDVPDDWPGTPEEWRNGGWKTVIPDAEDLPDDWGGIFEEQNLGRPIFNASFSVLWERVRVEFHEDLREAYREMRVEGGAFDTNHILKHVTEFNSQMSELDFNKNLKEKYIRFGTQWISRFHGTRLNHMLWMFHNRFIWLDTFYEDWLRYSDYENGGGGGNSLIRTGGNRHPDMEDLLNHEVPRFFDLEVTATCLMFINIGGGDQTDATTYLTRCNLEDNEPRADKPWRGTRIWLPNTGYDQEIQFYNPDLIRGFGDISWTNAQDIGVFNNLLEINLVGGDLLASTYSANFPKLQRMNFRNTRSIQGNVDLSRLRMLNFVDLRGTAQGQGASINIEFYSHLGASTALREIYLPTNINALELNGQTGLRILGIPFTLRTPDGYNSFSLSENSPAITNTYSNISTLRIINCPNIEQIGVNEGPIPVWEGRNLIALSRIHTLTIKDSLSPAFKHLDFSNMRHMSSLTLTDLPHVEELWFNDMGNIKNGVSTYEPDTGTIINGGIVTPVSFPMLKETHFMNLINCKKVLINTHQKNFTLMDKALGRAAFPEGFTLDLSRITGLETIECNDGVVGLNAIRIPTSTKNILFGNTAKEQGSTRSASVTSITTGSTVNGMDLSGTTINRMNLESLTRINNIINANIVPINEPILFNKSREINNFIQVAGVIDLRKFLGSSIDYLFKGLTGNNLNVLTPSVMDRITSAVETFAHSTMANDKRESIWRSLPNIQNATRMFMGSNIQFGLHMEQSHRLVEIADSMYQDCTNLTLAPTLPSSLKNAGAMFQGCSTLQSPPIIPEGILSVVNMFRDCIMLQRTSNMPNSIGNTSGMFQNCRQLISVSPFSENMSNATEMFRDCRNLASLGQELPNKLIFASGMFRDARNLISMPELPTSLVDASNMFRSCHKIVFSREIPSSLSNASNMFFDCPVLAVVPDDYKNIINASGMFAFCNNLTEATTPIPNSVVDMEMMFAATNLVDGPTKLGNSIRNMNSAFRQTKIKDFKLLIPNSVETMNNTFQSCKDLTTGPDSLSNVKNLNMTFAGCVSLENVPLSLPEQTIDASGMYMGCENLTKAPSLYNSTGLLNISHMFSNQSSTMSYFTLSLNEHRETTPSFSSLNTRPLQISTIPVNPQTNVRIPNLVSNASFAFYNCEKLTVLPDFPISLSGNGADSMYQGCSSATTGPNSIPLGLTSLNNTFNDCRALTTGIISFPNSISSANQAFRNCNNISAVPTNIPNGIINGSEMFLNCRQVTKTATSIPNTMTNTTRMFAGCERITTTVVNNIGQNVTAVDGMYENCTRLTEVPTSYSAQAQSTIGMFRKCINLNKTLNLSNAPFVTDMSSMYDGCSSLTNHPVEHFPQFVQKANFLFRNTAMREVRFPMALSGGSETVSMYEGTKISNIVNQAVSQTNAMAIVLPNASRMFANCLELEEVPVIPTNITGANELFAECKNLKVIAGIPGTSNNSLNVNGYLHGCTSLHTINNLNFSTITNTVTNKMPVNFWTGCSSLRNINFAPDSIGFDFDINVSMNITNNTLISLASALIHPSELLGRGDTVNVMAPIINMHPQGVTAIRNRSWNVNGTTELT